MSGEGGQIGHGLVIADGLGAGSHNGLVGSGLGHDDAVIAAGVAALGKALGIQAPPYVDEGAVKQLAVGQGALGLIHGHHHGAGGIGHAVIGELLGGHVDLHVVAGQILHLNGGVIQVLLVGAVHGNDVALGIEVAVLALTVIHRAHQVRLLADPVVLVHIPRSHELVGVGVVDAAGEQLGLGGQHVDLMVLDVHRLGHQTVRHHQLGADVAVHGQLPGDTGGTDQDGELGAVGGGHVIPGLGPGHTGGGILVYPQEITIGHLEAVVVGVVGNSAHTHGLAQLDELLGDQVVLIVGLVRRRAGLDEHGLHAAVDLGEHHGVELVHQGHSVGILNQGLIGLVAVGVIALAGGTGHVLVTLDILRGNDDHEHVAQQLLDVDLIILNVVILLQVQLAGIQAAVGLIAILAADKANVGGKILDLLGNGCALLFHLGLQLGLTGLGEALQGVDADGLILQQEVGKLQDTIDGGILVGMNVGGEHGDPQIVKVAVGQLGQRQVGVGFHQVGVCQPLVHRLLGVGNDQIRHVVAVHGGLAHGLLGHIQVGIRGGQGVDVVIQLIHGTEAVIGNNLGVNGAYRLVTGGHIQGIVAAQIQIRTAVAVRSAEIHVAGAVAEVAVDVDPQLQSDLARLIGRHAHIRNAEQVLGLLVLLPLGHPGVQSTALVGIGELFGVQIAAGAVAVQGQRQAAVHSGAQLFLRHVGRNGDLRLGILRQGDLPVDVGVCGIGICQGLARGTSVLRHVCNACKRRCGEYESEDQDKRQDLRRQTGSFVLHSFLLFFSFFSMVVLGGRSAGAAAPLLGLPPTAPACRETGAALFPAESLVSA